MKEFEEICGLFKRIAANPEAPVDYLTVGDYIQMGLHLDLCEGCTKLRQEVLDKYPHKNDVDINFGGASEN
jgi:hypothetical protein